MDPFITLFLAYGVDESPADIREYPIGRQSRIAPRMNYLRRRLRPSWNHDADYLTTTEPLMDNPDPHKERADTHHEEHGRDRPTRLILDPPDVLEIDIGRAFSFLSDDFSQEFRDYMMAYRWPLHLPTFRKLFLCWLWEAHTTGQIAGV
jgi:hypothetical protein